MRSEDLRRYARECAVLLLLCSALLACGGPEAERLGTEVDTEFVDQVTGDRQGAGSVTVTGVRRGSVDDLRHVYGVGSRKAEDLGAAVLEAIAAHPRA